jgi:hypothetical protein
VLSAAGDRALLGDDGRVGGLGQAALVLVLSAGALAWLNARRG